MTTRKDVQESHETKEAFRAVSRSGEFSAGLFARWVRLYGADLRDEIMKEVEANYVRRG